MRSASRPRWKLSASRCIRPNQPQSGASSLFSRSLSKFPHLQRAFRGQQRRRSKPDYECVGLRLRRFGLSSGFLFTYFFSHEWHRDFDRFHIDTCCWVMSHPLFSNGLSNGMCSGIPCWIVSISARIHSRAAQIRLALRPTLVSKVVPADRVARYLEQYQPELFVEFQKIARPQRFRARRLSHEVLGDPDS